MTTEQIAALPGATVLGLTLWGEARGESLDGRAAVAHVVCQRAADGRWPTSVTSVCLQAKQFSCWNANDANRRALELTAEAWARGEPPHPLVVECLWIARGVLNGEVRDGTHGANHYCTEMLYRVAAPAWTARMRRTAQIGSHVFFKG